MHDDMLFPVGTTYKPVGKNTEVCTVVDVHITRNLANEIVSIRYVATHNFCGQVITERNVLATTIHRGLMRSCKMISVP